MAVKRTPYELSLEARVDGTPGAYRFRTADGVLSKKSFRDAELLLLEHLWDAAEQSSASPRSASPPEDAGRACSSEPSVASAPEDADLGRLLCPQANYGVVGTVLGATADSVEMTESSARATQLCRLNADANGTDARVSLLADPVDVGGEFDTAAYAPKPYTPLAVGKQRIAGSLGALRPGGDLYLSAATRTGLARYEDCLETLTGCVERVRGRDGWHVVRATRPASFDSPQYVTTRWIHPTVDGVNLSLATVPGVFAADGLDHGTRLLLEAADVADGERVLDVCCGYGAAGAYAASVADCDVWLTDDDRLATTCAEDSLDEMGIEATVVTGDCVEGVAGSPNEPRDTPFDRVLCNPPTHAGRGVLSELFDGIYGVLGPGECVSLVHHRKLDLGTHLDQFETVSTLVTGEEHVVKRALR